MAFAKDDLIEALRARYDHYSAQTLFEMARERAGLDDKAALEAGELRAWREGLIAVGDRIDGVLERIDGMLATAGDSPAKPIEKKPDPTKADVAKAEVAKAEVAKAEVAKAEVAKPDVAKADSAAPEAANAEVAKPESTIAATLVLTGVKAGEGDLVLVCGETAALGDWDPARAKAMARKGDEWRLAIEVPARSELAFKFLRRGADGKVTWEGGDDRHAAAAPRIEAVWRG